MFSWIFKLPYFPHLPTLSITNCISGLVWEWLVLNKAILTTALFQDVTHLLVGGKRTNPPPRLFSGSQFYVTAVSFQLFYNKSNVLWEAHDWSWVMRRAWRDGGEIGSLLTSASVRTASFYLLPNTGVLHNILLFKILKTKAQIQNCGPSWVEPSSPLSTHLLSTIELPFRWLLPSGEITLGCYFKYFCSIYVGMSGSSVYLCWPWLFSF